MCCRAGTGTTSSLAERATIAFWGARVMIAFQEARALTPWLVARERIASVEVRAPTPSSSDRLPKAPRDRPIRSWISRPGQGDRIDLRLDGISNKAGTQSFTFIGDDKFTRTAGELRYDDAVLSGDRNGDGKADFSIKLANKAPIHWSDLFL